MQCIYGIFLYVYSKLVSNEEKLTIIQIRTKIRQVNMNDASNANGPLRKRHTKPLNFPWIS